MGVAALTLLKAKLLMAGPIDLRRESTRWAALATHLNGAADSGKYEHIDTIAVLRHLERGDLFEYLRRELGSDVSYALDRMDNAQRAQLLRFCRLMAAGYETKQFHVRRSGLALLVAYLLHLIQNANVRDPGVGPGARRVLA